MEIQIADRHVSLTDVQVEYVERRLQRYRSPAEE